MWLVNKTLVMTLCVGITFGFSFAYMVLTLAQYSPQGGFYDRLLGGRAREWFGPDPVSLFAPRLDGPLQLHTQPGSLTGHNVDVVPVEHSASDPAHAGGDTVALELAKRVRVLCWVMTQPANHEKKARHVKATWGKRCNKLLFMSTVEDPELPSVKLDVEEGRNFLWAKTKEAFRYVYEHHWDDADWFFKADDDTYAVMENMRFLLEPYPPQHPIYFGCKFKPFTKQGYMSGGAGYVLSREALRRFVEVGLKDPKKCRKDHGGAEDAEMGKCMEKLNVTAGDSRDAQGRYRFFPFTPESHLVAEKFPKNFWYWKYVFYPQPRGMDCCSDSAISFHYVPPNMMYTIEYLIYHLKPYGVRTRLIPAAPPDSAVIPPGVHFPTPPTTASPIGKTTVPEVPRHTTRAAVKAASPHAAPKTTAGKRLTTPAARTKRSVSMLPSRRPTGGSAKPRRPTEAAAGRKTATPGAPAEKKAPTVWTAGPTAAASQPPAAGKDSGKPAAKGA
ncbi:glycoprotein-N-acetylgalactosamine 3-beta-galactosyltransferase 1-like isoform X2 [Amphibalanus amphitrite]|uniref:glycoprotein-N-acetylgalactosamine 3-beta-galactosyltransferase 1-like isoform X2 n=1 Tax=Amphibalanus amphitrite TaxID=1232801 RepID=UPI001C924D45|nr:glycoprotein-N-acetylgalactosamine 3-beta-galactosyltransferase 1-like isoform X2 [Amphibalanus amphitrite]